MGPDLATYYERIRFITRGALFDRERLTEIVRFNLGRYGGLREGYVERAAGLP